MISHQEAKRLADEHLRAEGCPWVATHAARERGVWVVDYGDPGRPDARLDGGALVVTDEGDVHSLSSVPGSLEALLLDRGTAPASDTDSEALALLADLDPGEAAGLWPLHPGDGC